MSNLNYIEFGGPSHSSEYCIHLAGYDHENLIPPRISQGIAELLGDAWDVANRGTRIEIFSKKFFLGYRDDAQIVEAVKQVVRGDIRLLGDVAELRKFGLPMIQVMDETEHSRSGEIRFVKCAVIAETPDHWTVKPVEEPYFRADDLIGNGRFDRGWWRIAKKDGGAEPISETFDITVLSDHVLHNMQGWFEDLWFESLRAAARGAH